MLKTFQLLFITPGVSLLLVPPTNKKDTFALFLELRNNHSEDEIYSLLEPYEINKLDIKRIYRYLDKNITNEHILEEEEILGDIDIDNDIDIMNN